jgi:hypothetical protein
VEAKSLDWLSKTPVKLGLGSDIQQEAVDMALRAEQPWSRTDLAAAVIATLPALDTAP